ncbi:hypothetical protein E5288_WYG015055 [Bos mutus]|uniref:Uncharacterized protein n=1 Tax=Bos mutus TaxID=72004 RepID=A0A6B0RP47_9CETA|nr:hypothetical protein [Bos mutus]
MSSLHSQRIDVTGPPDPTAREEGGASFQVRDLGLLAYIAHSQGHTNISSLLLEKKKMPLLMRTERTRQREEVPLLSWHTIEGRLFAVQQAVPITVPRAFRGVGSELIS